MLRSTWAVAASRARAWSSISHAAISSGCMSTRPRGFSWKILSKRRAPAREPSVAAFVGRLLRLGDSGGRGELPLSPEAVRGAGDGLPLTPLAVSFARDRPPKAILGLAARLLGATAPVVESSNASALLLLEY